MKKTTLKVIAESPDFLVIDKPAGIMVHGDGRSTDITIADIIAKEYPEIVGVGESIEVKDGPAIIRPGIVHRLDKDTSGVLLIARTKKSFDHFKEMFKDRDMGKEYVAYVHGHIKGDEVTIDRPIARSRGDFRQWSAARGSRGGEREAVTHITVLKRGFDAELINKGGKRMERLKAWDAAKVSLISVKPETGRTHQIRVHCKVVNHPVIHDTLYAPRRLSLLGFTRLALHARKLSFTDTKGKEWVVESPLPLDFQNAEKQFKGVEEAEVDKI
jgi:23S rRNA pseudouridine1911/1915/1917 synthase